MQALGLLPLIMNPSVSKENYQVMSRNHRLKPLLLIPSPWRIPSAFVVLTTLISCMAVFLQAIPTEVKWLLGPRRIRVSDLRRYLPRISKDLHQWRGVYLTIGYDQDLNSWAFYVECSRNF